VFELEVGNNMKQYYDGIDTLEWQSFSDETLFYIVQSGIRSVFTIQSICKTSFLDQFNSCPFTRQSDYWYVSKNELELCEELFDNIDIADDNSVITTVSRLSSRLLTHDEVNRFLGFNPLNSRPFQFRNQDNRKLVASYDNTVLSRDLPQNRVEAVLLRKGGLLRRSWTLENIVTISKDCPDNDLFEAVLIELPKLNCTPED